jgi:hypothetical protein
MTILRRPRQIMQVLVAACIVLVGTASAALAQSHSAPSYSAKGQVGYLQEWEMKGGLAKTATHFSTSYSGSVTLRHVGLCSINGAEEKSGTLEVKVSSWTSNVEGTLALPDDECHIVASASQGYSGLLNCHSGQGIPIKFSIEQAPAADRSASAASSSR